MINKLKILGIVTMFNLSTGFAQVKVENDGSLYVNSYQANWGRANWTKVHYQNSCSYHLWNTYYNGDVFYVRGDGYVWTRQGFLTASDSIFKTNIDDIYGALSKVKNLRGVTYNRKYITESLISNYNNQLGNDTIIQETMLEPAEYGLIAQEVKNIVPEAVFLMHDSTLAISYPSLIPIMIEAMKEQQNQIENLQSIVNSQEIELNKIKNCCENNEKLQKTNSSEGVNENILYQNIPNPFNERTTINYYLKENTKNAVLNIYNMNGTQIKSINVYQFGNGSVIINAGEFNAGIYLYILIADGQPVDTKQMILIN